MAEAPEVTETTVAALFRALEARHASIVWAWESQIARAREAHEQSVASWKRFRASDIARKAAAVALPAERALALEFSRGCDPRGPERR